MMIFAEKTPLHGAVLNQFLWCLFPKKARAWLRSGAAQGTRSAPEVRDGLWCRQ
jgi:hypothetical protein